MKQSSLNPARRRTLLGGAALIAALAVGFTAAKLTTAKPPAGEATKTETASAAGADTLTLGPERLRASGVQIEPVATAGLAAEIVAQATIEAEPGAEAVLTARAAGSVSRLMKRLGDPVRAGELLALVESREAGQIAAARATAAAKADLARKVLAREQHLYEQKVSPRQDYEQAQAELAAAEAEARSASSAVRAADVSPDGRYVRVVSPINGRITASSANLGAFVQPETELFRIVDPSRVQVDAAVTAADAQRITPGDDAVVETSGGQTRPAVVRSVTPGVNEQTRSATVVLTLKGGGDVLQPGQLVRARITSRQSAATGIVVPEDAVQVIEGRDSVFVRTPKGFRVQPVTVGQRSAGRVQIAQGLKGGEAIATHNAFQLKAELGKSAEEE